jgi:type 1 glutamine amidotransferase
VTAIAALVLSACSEPTVDGADILVFHGTEGFHHDSIPAGVAAIREVGEDLGLVVADTDASSVFAGDGLDGVSVVVFLNTTGDVLDAGQEDALEAFVGAGGGFLGIHSAADTEYEWDWYGELIGARFVAHPAVQPAEVAIVGGHAITEGLPDTATITDEWYDFDMLDSAGDRTVLATLDEESYQGGSMGESHPISWAHDFSGGRSVYLGFGHTDEVFADPVVSGLLANSLKWLTTPVDS